MNTASNPPVPPDGVASPDTPPEKTGLEKLADHIYAQRGSDVLGTQILSGELIVTVRRDHIVPFLFFLRDDPGVDCKQLVDLCGVDQPERPQRFTVVYNLLSLRLNHRVRVKVATDAAMPVPSIIPVYTTAGWFEREAYDMYGIYFDGNPDLRRILTDYGFEGHPLRKDFPMTGFVELRYDPAQGRPTYRPVELVQDFRNFDFLSPWEGMTDMQLPGDEKATKPQRGWTPTDKKVG